MEADFSGYVTKAGLKCTDGRTITPEAFKHMDGKQVPLVWQHGHSTPENVLGHVLLEARPDGIYGHGHFNNTKPGQQAKTLVEHKDINSLSIYANQLTERAKTVFHGVIREVSLVLAGANPGAVIDQIRVAHGDGEIETLEDEAIITTGLELEHSDRPENENDEDQNDDGDEDENLEHATVKEVYDAMSEEQQAVLHLMISEALKAASDLKQSEGTNDNDLADKEGPEGMGRNVFEQNTADNKQASQGHALSHDDVRGIVQAAVRHGSLKAAVQEYGMQHGIDDIDVLFPDAKSVQDTPEWIKRRTEWVAGVMMGCRKTPFSRIKTRTASITHDEARAKGYIKGNVKKEEFFGVMQRTTTPTTIYKKQGLDRDDIIDITDFDVVAWLKGEMRLMMEEEFARAILLGDGRDVSDDDKVRDPAGATDGAGIRSILNDHELYVTRVDVNIGATPNWNNVVESVLRARRFYKGTGSPVFYTTEIVMTEMLLAKDGFGRRLYESEQALATALRVSRIVAVEVMEDPLYADLLGIVVNLSDYNVGTDRGGELNFFDDFDIDYNKYKYLMETRASGALTKVKSAMVITRTDDVNVLVAPQIPSFVASTGVVTIPNQTGVVYEDASDPGTPLAPGAQAALDPSESITVQAFPAAGYYFATNENDSWTFTRPA